MILATFLSSSGLGAAFFIRSKWIGSALHAHIVCLQPDSYTCQCAHELLLASQL